jgi:antitoxin CcdA
MKDASTQRACKVPMTLSLWLDLVQRAKALDLELSEVVETALEKAILEAEQARWLAENKDAIDYYNAFVEKYGYFGEEFREF